MSFWLYTGALLPLALLAELNLIKQPPQEL